MGDKPSRFAYKPSARRRTRLWAVVSLPVLPGERSRGASVSAPSAAILLAALRSTARTVLSMRRAAAVPRAIGGRPMPPHPDPHLEDIALVRREAAGADEDDGQSGQ